MLNARRSPPPLAQRLPQIDALKSQEVLRGNNRGFLGERKSGATGQGDYFGRKPQP